MNIAVILSHGHVTNGLHSNVSSEARASLNYAWMLSTKGHRVDLIPIPGVSLSGGALHTVNLGQAFQSYDVCVCPENVGPGFLPKADFYLQFSFRPIVAAHNIKQMGLGDRNAKLCMVFKDCAYIHGSSKLDENRLNYPVFPLPIPGDLDYNPINCFNRKELIWTTKYSYGYEEYHQDLTDSLSIKQIPFLMARIFSEYGGTFYTFNSVLRETRGLEIYSVRGHNNPMLYNELLAIMPRCKLAITAYFTGSVLETVLCGCLPLIWEFEIPGSPVGNWPFVREARELGCILRPSKGWKEIREIVTKLMMDKEYYIKVLSTYKQAAQDYTFDGSYKAFLELVNN
jgi:hypothetical protein